MRIIILTSTPRGIASRVLPELCRNSSLEIAGVVLAHGSSPKKNNLERKIRKTVKIGILGALNGIRMRSWFADSDAEDIDRVCQRLGVQLAETPFVNSDMTVELFKKFNADVGLSLGNGYIAKKVFSIPRFGMVNIHTEILPDFQGAQSIIWPIYENRKETGFTIHQVDSKIDTGDILLQERYPIEFKPTLEDTVRQNLRVARDRIPSAFSYVCENYESLRERASPQTNGRSYTTPSMWQFLRMVRNHRALYKEFETAWVP